MGPAQNKTEVIECQKETEKVGRAKEEEKAGGKDADKKVPARTTRGRDRDKARAEAGEDKGEAAIPAADKGRNKAIDGNI